MSRLRGDRGVDVAVLRSEKLRRQVLLVLTQQVVRLHDQVSRVERRQRHSLLHHRVLLQVVLLQLRMAGHGVREWVDGVLRTLYQRRRPEIQTLLVENVGRFRLAVAGNAERVINRSDTRSFQCRVVVGREVSFVGIFVCEVVDVLPNLILLNLRWDRNSFEINLNSVKAKFNLYRFLQRMRECMCGELSQIGVELTVKVVCGHFWNRLAVFQSQVGCGDRVDGAVRSNVVPHWFGILRHVHFLVNVLGLHLQRDWRRGLELDGGFVGLRSELEGSG